MSGASLSPLTAHLSHGEGTARIASAACPVPSRAPRRATTHPVPLEPLSFAKVPLSPAPSAPTSAVWSSTESEAFSDPERDLSRSPSLLTSLIQSQCRISTLNGPLSPITPLSPAASPILQQAKFATFPRGTAPILRHDDSGSEGEKLAEKQDAAPRPTIRHRRSCLKFAVTPRPLQLPTPKASHRADSPPPPSVPQARPESEEENEEEDGEDEDEDEEVTTPGWASDSDAGYREDSEDGFTSDEDVLSLAAGPSRWRGQVRSYTTWAAPPAPILSTSRRRIQIAECPSTTDDGEPGRARARIRIRDEDNHEHRKPTRHRSPPPCGTRMSSDHGRPAPPAARSPSAAELCRRRSGCPRSPCPDEGRPRAAFLAAARGWRSDDGRSRVPEEQVRPAVKFELREAQLHELQQCREHRRDDTTRPTAFRLARRDSAPARVDEVHVFTSAGAPSCPRRGLKNVLQAARIHV